MAAMMTRNERARIAVVRSLRRVGREAAVLSGAGVDVTSPTRRDLLDALAGAHRLYQREHTARVAVAAATWIMVALNVVVAVVVRRLLPAELPDVVGFWMWLAATSIGAGLAVWATCKVQELGVAYAALVQFVLLAARVQAAQHAEHSIH